MGSFERGIKEAMVGVIGGIVIALFLPIFQITQLIGQ